MVGHVVGEPVRGNQYDRVFIEADPSTGANRLAVAYRVTEDTVTLLSLMIVF